MLYTLQKCVNFACNLLFKCLNIIVQVYLSIICLMENRMECKLVAVGGNSLSIDNSLKPLRAHSQASLT
jgi:hypothetical protein